MDAGKSAKHGFAVKMFELLKAAAVDEARHDLAVVGRDAPVGADDSIDFLGRMARRFTFPDGPAQSRRLAKIGDDVARNRQRVAVTLGDMVGDAANSAVHLRATERFDPDRLAGRGNTSCGLPRNIAPWLRTITASSHSAGM